MRNVWLFISLVVISACGETISPQAFETDFKAIQELHSKGEYEIALQQSEELLAKGPSSNDSSRLYYLQYYCKLEQGTPLEGYSMLLQAVATAQNPNLKLQAVIAILYTLVNEGNYAEALSYCEEYEYLGDLDPKPELWHDHFLVHWVRNAVMVEDWTLAKQIMSSLNWAYISDEHQELVKMMVAITHLHQGAPAQALKDAQAFLDSYGLSSAQAYLALETMGVAHWDMGNLEGGRAYLEQAYALKKEEPQIAWNLMGLHADAGNEQESVRWARVLVSFPTERTSMQNIDYMRDGYRTLIVCTEDHTERERWLQEAREFDAAATQQLTAWQAQVKSSLEAYAAQKAVRQGQYLKKKRAQAQWSSTLGVGGVLLGILMLMFGIWKYRRYRRALVAEEMYWGEIRHSADRLEEALEHLG